MAPLYETLVADSVLELDQGLLDSMRAKIEEELKKLDEKWVFVFSSFAFWFDDPGKVGSNTSILNFRFWNFVGGFKNQNSYLKLMALLVFDNGEYCKDLTFKYYQ